MGQYAFDLGFSAITDDLTDDQVFLKYASNEAEFDLAVVDGELDNWLSMQQRSSELLQYHEKALLASGFLYAEIDELRGELDVWTSDPDAITDKGPVGVSIHASEFSLIDIENFIADAEWTDTLERNYGLRVSSTIEGPAGLTVEASLLGSGDRPDDALVANATMDVQRLARRAGAAFPVVVVGVIAPSEAEVWCDARFRCDNIGGGTEWGSCTSGFVMQDPTTDRRGISTAGHCSNNVNFRVRGTDTGSAGNSAHQNLSISSLHEQFNPDYDMQIARDVTSDAGSFPATYFRDPNYGNRPVTGVVSSPANGLIVCMSGRNSPNRRCGTIADNDYDSGSTQNGLRIAWLSGGFVSAGDSGAPITKSLDSKQAVATMSKRILGGQYEGDGVAYRVAATPTWLSGYHIALAANENEGKADSYSARLYRNALQREPSFGEMEYWSNFIDNSSNCQTAAQNATAFFLTSSEFKSAVALNSTANRRRRVRRLYWTAFNRIPDPGGENYWIAQIPNEAAWVNVVNFFVYSVSEATNAINGRVGTQEGPC